MPLPTSIRCFYGGNSSPSANFDQSTFARHLTAIGSPSSPSSPTPPEGDQWLLGASDPLNYWQMPAGSFPTAFAAWVGVVAFKINYQNNGLNQENFFRFGNGGAYRFEVSRINPVGSALRAVWSIDNNFNNVNIDVPESLVPGTTHEIRVESRLTGVKFILDGVEIGSNPNPVFVNSDTKRAIGGELTLCSSFIDAFMISDLPNEPFPSAGSSAAILTARGSRR